MLCRLVSLRALKLNQLSLLVMDTQQDVKGNGLFNQVGLPARAATARAALAQKKAVPSSSTRSLHATVGWQRAGARLSHWARCVVSARPAAQPRVAAHQASTVTAAVIAVPHYLRVTRERPRDGSWCCSAGKECHGFKNDGVGREVAPAKNKEKFVRTAEPEIEFTSVRIIYFREEKIRRGVGQTERTRRAISFPPATPLYASCSFRTSCPSPARRAPRTLRGQCEELQSARDSAACDGNSGFRARRTGVLSR